MLDLNEYEGDVPSVLNSVGCAERDIDGITSPHIDAAAIKGDDTLSTDHKPVLGTT